MSTIDFAMPYLGISSPGYSGSNLELGRCYSNALKSENPPTLSRDPPTHPMVPPRNSMYCEAEHPSTAPNGKGAKSDRYKTELCRPFSESGACRYGDKCQFAHGTAELRTVTRHPKYKTNLCRTFHSTGFCPYGSRCHFIHGDTMPKSEVRFDSKAESVCPATGSSWNQAAPAVSSVEQKDASGLQFRDGLDIQQLILGIKTLMNQRLLDSCPTAELHHQEPATTFPLQQYRHFSSARVSPSLEGWSRTYAQDLVGSTAASPSLSYTDSPTPSPTAMMLPDNDIWSSLANIIRVGV